MSTIYAVFEKLDDQISSTISEWNLWTTAIALLLASVVACGVILWEDPDTHPFLLLRQSTPAPVRQPGGSAVYRSPQRPHGYPLRSGLDIKVDGAPVWAAGKDGDLRDIWKQAVAGSRDEEGQHPARSGRIFTIRGKEEVFEHELGNAAGDERGFEDRGGADMWVQASFHKASTSLAKNYEMSPPNGLLCTYRTRWSS